MPLSTRRRRKPARARQQETKSSAYPVGESALEQLPLEVLTSIFIESQNLNFVRISKTIFARLGQSPSDWLILEFFGPGREASLQTQLFRAIEIQGFTVQLYSRWIDKYGYPYGDTPPYVRKRWLRPENEAALCSLLNNNKLSFAANRWPRKSDATLKNGLAFYSDPQVTKHWAMAMLCYDRGYDKPLDDIANCCRDLLRAAFKKPNIDDVSLYAIILHKKFLLTRGTLDEMSWAAFESGNRTVIAWASELGLVPTVHQLKRLFLHTNNHFDLRSA